MSLTKARLSRKNNLDLNSIVRKTTIDFFYFNKGGGEWLPK